MKPIHHTRVIAAAAGILLLATGTVAAAGDDDARAAAPAAKVAPMRIVKFFATVEDKSGSVEERPQVMIQSETSEALEVGSGGAKLSLSATKPSTLTLLTTGPRCNVTFDPAKLKADVLTIRMKRKDKGIDCALAKMPDSPKEP